MVAYEKNLLMEQKNNPNLTGKQTTEDEHQRSLDDKYAQIFEAVLSAPESDLYSSSVKDDKANEISRKRTEKTNTETSSPTKRRRKETIKDRLLEWYDYYTSVKFGIWIQCTKCNKWRKVTEFEEDHEVPTNWHCSMSFSGYRCSDPEENTKHEEYASTKFIPGSIVYAKVHGYPWWPAMVEDDPDTEEYYWTEKNGTLFYNVTFLDKKVTRAWVQGCFVCSFFTPPQQAKDLKRKYGKTNYATLIQEAEKRASVAVTMPIKDRLKNFGFIYQYKGSWPLAEDFELEENEELAKLLIKEVEDIESITLSDSDDPDLEQEIKIEELKSIKSSDGQKQNSASDCKKKRENEVKTHLMKCVNENIEKDFEGDTTNLRKNRAKQKIERVINKTQASKNTKIHSNVKDVEIRKITVPFTKSAKKAKFKKISKNSGINSNNLTMKLPINEKDEINFKHNEIKDVSKGTDKSNLKLIMETSNFKTAFMAPIKQKESDKKREKTVGNNQKHRNMHTESEILNDSDENILNENSNITVSKLNIKDNSKMEGEKGKLSQNISEGKMSSNENADIKESKNVSGIKNIENSVTNLVFREKHPKKALIKLSSNSLSKSSLESNLRNEKAKEVMNIKKKANHKLISKEIQLNINNDDLNKNILDKTNSFDDVCIKSNINEKINLKIVNKDECDVSELNLIQQPANKINSSDNTAKFNTAVKKDKKQIIFHSKHLTTKEAGIKDKTKQKVNVNLKAKENNKESNVKIQGTSVFNERVSATAGTKQKSRIQNYSKNKLALESKNNSLNSENVNIETINFFDSDDNRKAQDTHKLRDMKQNDKLENHSENEQNLVLEDEYNSLNSENIENLFDSDNMEDTDESKKYFTLHSDSKEQSENDSDPFEAD